MVLNKPFSDSFTIEIWDNNYQRISIECTKRRVENNEIIPEAWAILQNNDLVMSNKTGVFEYSPLPSSRDEDFFKEFRFATFDEALSSFKKFYPNGFEEKQIEMEELYKSKR